MDKLFSHRFRVRYAEVDPQAVVFNSRYLEYADVLVSEFFRDRRAHGLPAGLEFHIRRAEVDYIRPIRSEELLEGRLAIERIGNSSMAMRIALHGVGEGGADPGADDLRAEILLVQVHVDLATGRPLRIPDSLREAFGFPLGEPVDG
ncbi:thioesterase family protein [Qipengyuania sp. DY56-A-20]|jgi:acyl-CoA thioester hydrolase|uniref:Thioesterase family protein n=1 Tax=Qipengyuania benthica TaxID=3067651 RepID=A0ABT9HBE2_9SPHN|nr:thioesterase family protein [Qipengyuania sp. DY56-A-20]MBU1254510.1 acyl-CoA thioesterase [Alphaproteobacteria bacterium]MBU1605673.1 acyl-CoA thioesterase [Alphaproteobacteria bacterium]MDP4540650.1 thioesterase family protein [Qipengyuania sp. DY56-A-20]